MKQTQKEKLQEIMKQLNNLASLNYQDKQELIKNIKKIYEMEYGYINKFNQVINCGTYEKLRINLGIGSMFNMGIKLVIQ